VRWLAVFAGVLALAAGAPLSSNGAVWAQVKHNCAFCHDLHGGSYTALRDTAVVEDLCLSCHGPAGPATVNRDGDDVPVPKDVNIHNGSKHSQPTNCWDCHDHESQAGGNLFMIPTTVATPNSGDKDVIFTATTGANSYADGDATYDGVCEVCHTTTAQHRNDGGAGQHNAAVDCITCHSHDSGFQGAGSCVACHNQAQDNGDGIPASGRRAMLGEFGRTSHHIDTGVFPPDSIPESDCETCHDQSLHQAGNVRLKDVDDPTNPAKVVVLTGDPFVDQTEADKLAPFCLACHDADAAGGSAPFSDGLTPPVVVDLATWSSPVSHNAAGKASCFGCHGSGHGSEKPKMLMPDVGAAGTPDSANVQEGFCLQCHDSDGPASTDLATGFSQAINWVQTATGLNSNPNLNDRHDVQYSAQTTSGAKLECINCHNPHTATSSLPYVLDPDPTAGDNHVVGTDWYYYSATSDTLSEFCLDCHDGTFPPGVLDHTSPTLVNIQSTWAADAMGGRTASATDLRAGTGWVQGDVIPCWTCHTPHVVIDKDIGPAPGTTTLFHLVEMMFRKNGGPGDSLPFADRKGFSTYAYGVTDNVDKNDATSGGYWCNTCHERLAMSGKVNCYGCHRHGDGGRF
jgi:hypothetical protein